MSRSPVALLLASALSLCALAAAGCGRDHGTNPAPPAYDSIYVSAPRETLQVGESVTMSAAVFDSSGRVPLPQLTWTTSNPTVITVSASGVASAHAEGAALVRAVGGGVTSNAVTLFVVQGRGWLDQSSGALTLSNLNGVHFADLYRGWVVGDLGTVLVTGDGGITWARQASGSTSYRLNSVYFPQPRHGFAVGSTGRVIETTDGGAHWLPRTGLDTGGRDLFDVFFLGPGLGFIVGDAGVILRTLDGGGHWERALPSRTDMPLRSVWATDVPGPDTVAWAVGDQGTIVGTRDAGRTWTLFVPAGPFTAENLLGVARPTTASALAVGLQDAVLRTVARGDSADWILAPPPTDFSSLHDVAWPAPARAYAVGENSAGRASVLLSADGGLTWATQALPSQAPIGGNALRAVWFVDAEHGWAVGEQGLILHTATGGEP